MPEKTGTFVVDAADEDSAVLRSVSDSQVHPLEENPGLSEEAIVEATIASNPPLDVVWSVVSIESIRTIDVSVADERPAKPSREAAADLEDGEARVEDRIEDGEVHVLTVPENRVEETMASVRSDRATVVRAARIGAERVEIRGEPGLVSVRYLP